MDTLEPMFRGLAGYGSRTALNQVKADGSAEISYAALGETVARCAAGIRRAGLAGRTVALLADGGPEWITACLSLIGAGAVPVPLDTQLDSEVLRHVLDDCEAGWVLCDRNKLETLAAIGCAERALLLDPTVSGEQGWRRWQIDDVIDFDHVSGDDTALLFYTSGTTGPPKGVPLKHRNVAFQLEAIGHAGLVDARDRVLQPLPPHHVYPLIVGTLAPLSLGLTIVLPEAMMGPQIVAAIREGRATFVIGVPRLYGALLAAIDGRIDSQRGLAGAYLRGASCASLWLRRRLSLRLGKWLLGPLHRRLSPDLRVLASGGAALDPDLAWRLEGLGWQVAIGYGLTETSPLLTLNPAGSGRLDSVGRAIPGIEIRIDDAGPRRTAGDSAQSDADEESEDEVPGDDGTGEILARGPGVFGGYLHPPPGAEDAFTADGWFRTGDLGRLDEDGYLVVMGRKSTLIVTSAGKNLQPDELEESYAQHDSIEEIGILADGDALAAVVVPNLDAIRRRGLSVTEAIRHALGERAALLASYKRVSRHVISRESLPRTRLGKIQRHRLKALYTRLGTATSQPTDRAPSPPGRMSARDQRLLENDAAQETWKILTQRYPQRCVTPDAHIELDLGVDSLGWLDLSTEIAQRAQVALDEERIADIATVRDLLEMVASAETAEGVRAAPLDSPQDFLNEHQKRWLEPLPRTSRLLARSMYALNRSVVKGLFRLQISGVDQLPRTTQLVIAPNHTSFLDAFAVAAALPTTLLESTFWGGWTGYAFRNPLTRAVSKLTHIVPIDPARASSSSLAYAAAVLGQNGNLVWFPEGERSRTGEIVEFKRGLGLLLERFPSAAIVPTYIGGAYEAWPPDRALPRFKRVSVAFGKAIIDHRQLERKGSGDDVPARLTNGLRAMLLEMKQHAGA